MPHKDTACTKLSNDSKETEETAHNYATEEDETFEELTFNQPDLDQPLMTGYNGSRSNQHLDLAPRTQLSLPDYAMSSDEQK